MIASAIREMHEGSYVYYSRYSFTCPHFRLLVLPQSGTAVRSASSIGRLLVITEVDVHNSFLDEYLLIHYIQIDFVLPD